MDFTKKRGKLSYQDYLNEKHRQRNTPSQVVDEAFVNFTKEKVLEKTRLIEGENSEVYDILTSSGKGFVVRISHGPFRYRAERWALIRCQKLNLPTPKVVVIKDFKLENKRLSLCIEVKLSGSSLAKEKNEIGKNPVKFKKIALKIGEALSQIHSIKTSGFGVLNSKGQGEYKDWKEYLFEPSHNLPSLYQALKVNGLDLKLADKYLQLLQKYGKLISKTPKRLLHGDLTLKHILIVGAKVSGIIDFEWCKSGDPIDDLAYWDYYAGQYLNTEWLISGYSDKKILEDNFNIRFHLLRMRLGLYQLRDEYWGNVEWAKKNLKKEIDFFKLN